MSHEVVFLSDADVRNMLTISAAIEAVEADFKRQAVPESMIYGVPLAYATDDLKLGFRWRLKTAIIRDFPIAGMRVTGYKIDENGIGSGGEREATRYIILSDPETASPLAIIDEHSSFGMRTSAAVCVAAKYLARPDSKVAAIIGVGNVGRNALDGLQELFNLDGVRVMSARSESRNKFAAEMSSKLNLPVQAVSSYEEACTGADIILAATPSVEPFIRYEWLKPGVFVGVMGLEEAAHEVYSKIERLFVDYNPETEKHPSHIQHAIDAGAIPPGRKIHQLWEVVAGTIPGRRDDAEKILVSTVGLTTQDIAIARSLFLQAQENGVGMRLPF